MSLPSEFTKLITYAFALAKSMTYEKRFQKKRICMSLIKVSNMVTQKSFDDNLEG